MANHNKRICISSSESRSELADFGLARSYSSDHKGNLTNRVITLWYRPLELLLGATRYGPSVDMWSVGCIFAELLHGKPILTGKNKPQHLNKIFELCGSPDEINWPGVSRYQWYSKYKPSRPMKRHVREIFRHFDRNALELLEKMLALDPSQGLCHISELSPDWLSKTDDVRVIIVINSRNVDKVGQKHPAHKSSADVKSGPEGVI